MAFHDSELPEDHDALLRLAADVTVVPAAPAVTMPTQVRALDITDEATALVGDPAVGISTHGR